MPMPLITRSELEDYLQKALTTRFVGYKYDEKTRDEAEMFLKRLVLDLASQGIFAPRDLNFTIVGNTNELGRIKA